MHKKNYMPALVAAILLVSFLCGCGARIDAEGALRFCAENLHAGKAVLVAEDSYPNAEPEHGQLVKDDIVWTFQLTKRPHHFLWIRKNGIDVTFHVVNYHYWSGIDATDLLFWETATDYELLLFQQAIEDGYITPNWSSTEEKMVWSQSSSMGRENFPIQLSLVYSADLDRESALSEAAHVKRDFLRWKHDHGLAEEIYDTFSQGIQVVVASSESGNGSERTRLSKIG